MSDEYAMVKAAALAGHLDECAIEFIALASMRRARADIIISYHAKDVARWIQ